MRKLGINPKHKETSESFRRISINYTLAAANAFISHAKPKSEGGKKFRVISMNLLVRSQGAFVAEITFHRLHLLGKTGWGKPKGSTVWRNQQGIVALLYHGEPAAHTDHQHNQAWQSWLRALLARSLFAACSVCHTKTPSTQTQPLYSADSECSDGRSGLACLVD